MENNKVEGGKEGEGKVQEMGMLFVAGRRKSDLHCLGKKITFPKHFHEATFFLSRFFQKFSSNFMLQMVSETWKKKPRKMK